MCDSFYVPLSLSSSQDSGEDGDLQVADRLYDTLFVEDSPTKLASNLKLQWSGMDRHNRETRHYVHSGQGDSPVTRSTRALHGGLAELRAELRHAMRTFSRSAELSKGRADVADARIERLEAQLLSQGRIMLRQRQDIGDLRDKLLQAQTAGTAIQSQQEGQIVGLQRAVASLQLRHRRGFFAGDL